MLEACFARVCRPRGGMRPDNMQSRWGGEASLQNPVQRGHLFSVHRHTRVTNRALFSSSPETARSTFGSLYVSHMPKNRCFNRRNKPNRKEFFLRSPNRKTRRNCCWYVSPFSLGREERKDSFRLLSSFKRNCSKFFVQFRGGSSSLRGLQKPQNVFKSRNSVVGEKARFFLSLYALCANATAQDSCLASRPLVGHNTLSFPVVFRVG